jgi:hypothetical protein
MPSSGLRRTPKFQKGALVQLPPSLSFPVPNIIPFQYNPAKVSRSLEPHYPSPPPPEDGKPAKSQSSVDPCALLSPMTQPCHPIESISMEVELDASDDLEQDDAIAKEFGVAPRIAALEKLLFAHEDLLGALLSLVPGLSGILPPERPTVPVVLLVWGIGRIVPVRVTRYSIEETLFLPSLRPMQATVSLSLEVITSSMLRGKTTISTTIAQAAYDLHRVQQEALALLNLASVAGNASVSLSLKI